jgi:hypothetical protein
MLIKQYRYPLDITGTAITNKVINEPRNISPGNGQTYNFFLPKAAPFFGNSLVVRHAVSGTVLVPGIDYVPSYRFISASNTAGTDVFGAVTILNTFFTGTFNIDYQSLGGEYTYDEQSLLEILAATQIDPRVTNWESVIDNPSLYDPEDHLHHASTSMGYDEMVAALQNLVTEFTLQTGQLKQYIDAHRDDMNNPHGVNLLLLGIERFQNVFLSPINEMLAGVNNLNYASPAGVKAVVDQFWQRLNTEHFSLSNPHGTDKYDIELSNVENWLPATQLDANNKLANRYTSPSIVDYMIGQTVAQLPTALITSLQTLVQQHIANGENPHNNTTAQLGIGLANLMVGLNGQLPFYKGTSTPFDMQSDMLLKNLAVVTNASDLTTQLAARESFADVFNSWQRIAFFAGNPNHTPSELTGWTYNSGTDTISSTINSGSVIGLLSPDKVSGDYVFEVELRSANSDDDAIGVIIGMEPAANSYRLLVVERWATVPTSGGGKLRLVTYDSTGVNNFIDVDGLPSYTNGWAGYNAIGSIKLKVTRVGSVLTISTSDANGPYNVSRTYDLNADPRTSIFSGPVNLGYSAFSQANASYTTVARTGANPTIASIHSNEVYNWNGTTYVLSLGTPLTSVLLPGRLYRNSTNKRVYFSPTAGSALLINGTSGFKDLSSPDSVIDKVLYSDTSGITCAGLEIDFFHQNPSTGAMTLRGKLNKGNDNGIWTLRSNDSTSDQQLLLGGTTALYGGVKVQANGTIGFCNGDATAWRLYVTPDNILNHYGAITRVSDPSVKNVDLIAKVEFNESAIHNLNLCSWTWREDERLPSSMYGQSDWGLLTSDVAAFCPALVYTNNEGLQTYEQSKLGLVLGLLAHRKLDKLERLISLSDTQWNKLLKLLEE